MYKELIVVNKHTVQDSTNINIYIGRGSVLGNPYSHLDSVHEIIKVESREIAVAKYQEYLIEKIKSKDENITKYLKKIIECLKISDVNLVCFCTPKLCHGTIIKGVIENILKNKK